MTDPGPNPGPRGRERRLASTLTDPSRRPLLLGGAAAALGAASFVLYLWSGSAAPTRAEFGLLTAAVGSLLLLTLGSASR